MKKILSLALLFSGFVQAQTVNIPDANFKAKLIALNLDADHDGEIQNSEAEGITTLSVYNCSISDLTGIEAFTNLVSLSCENNQLTALNVSALTNLYSLNCNSNQISTLNILGMANLGFLECANNQLGSLDLSPVPNLIHLYCDLNHLTTLDVTSLVNLNYLACGNNQLSALDITPLVNLNTLECSVNQISFLNLTALSNLTELYCENNFLNALDLSTNSLTQLYCGYNQLTALDVSNSPLLLHLYCSANQLTTLDLSAQTTLLGIECFNNQLSTLFIKNGHADNVTFYNNPFTFICADEAELTSIQNALDAWSIPNVNLNSYCSFVPGGRYNTITGTLRFDSTNDGCDASDSLMPNVRLRLEDGLTQGTGFTDAAGIYKFYMQSGVFTITPELERPDYFTVTPATAVVTLPSVNETVEQNFCITANGVHPDLEIVLMPVGPARPGFDAYYRLIFKNKGNQTISGSINLAFDDARTDFVSAFPVADSQTLNSTVWNFSNLNPFEMREINVTLNINSPLEEPAVNLNDVLDYTATINFVQGDETPQDNIAELHQIVLNSMDPNDKTCIEGNTVHPDNIGKYLHYNINFENTGTADAVNIVVKDMIDPAKFDINTLELLYASHPVNTKIKGNTVEFIFEGINLPPSSLYPIGGHGNVLFKIQTRPSLAINDEVTNTANIFFDYNAPIATNEARTAFRILGTPGFVTDNSVHISPNPAKDHVAIRAKSKITSIQLFDIAGRILQATVENKVSTTLDLFNNPSGTYFLKITTENGTKIEKIIKE
jgi:hypothetical protein